MTANPPRRYLAPATRTGESIPIEHAVRAAERPPRPTDLSGRAAQLADRIPGLENSKADRPIAGPTRDGFPYQRIDCSGFPRPTAAGHPCCTATPV